MNSGTFIFSSISLSFDNFDELVSLDALELLDLCESFGFFEFKIPLWDMLLLLLDEHFDDLILWAVSFSQQCTLLLTYLSVNIIKPIIMFTSFIIYQQLIVFLMCI